MYHAVTSVRPLPDYRLDLVFDNGAHRALDMSPWLKRGLFAQLRDPRLFGTVHVSFDTVEWENGADVCPEVLYEKSAAVPKTARKSGRRIAASPTARKVPARRALTATRGARTPAASHR
jgi:hypothetical protein